MGCHPDPVSPAAGTEQLLGELLAAGGKVEALGHSWCPGAKVDARVMAMWG